MTRFRELNFPYDMSFIKSQESASKPRIFLRVALIMAAALAGLVVFEVVPFFIWGLCYSACMVTWNRVIQALPDRVGRRGFALIMLLSAVYGISYIWIVWYGWTRPEEVLHYAAFAAMAGAMLNAVSMRSDDFLMGLTDMVLALVTVSWMSLHYLMEEGPTSSTVFFAIFMAALGLYLVASIYDANAARTRLRRANRTEVEQTKLQALGQLTGGVAHDFNNLLTVIIGNLDLRREADLAPEDEEELLAEVEAAARKASVLTSHLLAFSRRSPLEEQLVDLRYVVEEARTLLRRLLPVTHKLVVRSPANLPKICVDVSKLETVIVNLVMNARDAMPAGGTITFRACCVNFPEGRPLPSESTSRAGSPLDPGRYLQLSVEDNGSGIPLDVLPKVLEPYFTTKPIGKGSGLGLPMALGFAEQSGGTLGVNSIVGTGTRVSLWFPVPTQDEPEECGDEAAA